MIFKAMSASNGRKGPFGTMAKEMNSLGSRGGTNLFLAGTPKRKVAPFNPPASAKGGLGQRNIIILRECVAVYLVN